jgi:hypothetical protein
MISYTHWGNIIQIADSSPGIVISFCSMFGMLSGSLVIVLINSLILILLKYIKEKIFSSNNIKNTSKVEIISSVSEAAIEKRWYCFPDVRAPPEAASWQK